MTLKDLEPNRSTILLSIPIAFGFVVDINAGTALIVVGVITTAYGQFVYRHGEAKARAHRLWIDAQNASLMPELEQGRAEREELKRRIEALEGDLEESVRAERDLAIASLVISGNIKGKNQ